MNNGPKRTTRMNLFVNNCFHNIFRGNLASEIDGNDENAIVRETYINIIEYVNSLILPKLLIWESV
jgi:hypothetical protein